MGGLSMPKARCGAGAGRWQVGALAVVALLCLALQACGNPSAPNPPAGVYTSAAYGFTVSYPVGWKANALAAVTSAPLILIITKSATGGTPGAQVSTFTLDVLSLKNSAFAANAALLPKDKALTHITLAGQPAYRDTPVAQQTQGSSVVVTHTDYYLLHGAYEYQISTDAVAGDATAVQGIVNSFALSAG